MVMESLEEDPGQGNHETTGNGDDLTQIRGIGPNRQQWLHNVMGIMTLHDLATATADEIESHFRQEGQPIARIEIERWIAQAQTLDQGLEATAVDIDLDRDETLEPPVEADVIAEISHPAEAISAASGDVTPDPTWNNISTFTVAFQTRQMAEQTQQQAIVQHNESNYVTTWVDSEAGLFPDWMLAQVRARIPSPASTPEVPVAVSERMATLPLEISQLAVCQPPQVGIVRAADIHHRQLATALCGNEPFDLTITVTLVDPEVVIPPAVTYVVQGYVRHRMTGQVVTLGETEWAPLVPGQFVYGAELTHLTLSSGLYRLQIMVVLKGAIATSGHFEIPLFQVV